MPVSPEESGKIRLPPRIVIQILVFALLAGASALALRPAQRFIQGEIGSIRDTVLARAESVLGCTVQYDSIRPGLIYAFDIRGIRVHAPDSRQLVSIARLRISYSLWNLIWGNKRAVHSALVDRLYISIDTEQDRHVLENLKNLSENGNERTEAGGAEIFQQLRELLPAYMPENAVVKIRGARCRVQNDKNQFIISGGYGDIRAREKELSLNGRVTGNIAMRQIPASPVSANFNLRLRGAYSTETGEGRAYIAVPFVSTPFFRLHPLAFDVGLQSNSLVLRKAEGSSRWGLSLEYGFDSGAFSARYACDKLALRDLLTFDGTLKNAGAWLSLANSGEALFDYYGDGNFQYSVNIDGAVPPAEGTGALSFHARGNAEQAYAGEFFLDAPWVAENVQAGVNSGAKSGGPFRGEIAFKGSIGAEPLAPDGILSLKDLTFSENGNINGEFHIGTQNGVIRIFCQTLELGAVSLAAVDAAVSPADGSVGFMLSALRFRNIESYSNVTLGTLSVGGAVDYEPAQISVSLRLDSFSAGDVEGMLRPFAKGAAFSSAAPNLLNGILITTEIFFDTDFEHILYNVPRFVIALESDANDDNKNQFAIGGLNLPGIQNGVGLFSLSGTDHSFNLSEGSFIINGNLISLSGLADYTNPLDINFSLMANYRDISYYLEGFILDRRSLNIQGTHGLSVYIDSGANGSYSGFLQVADMPIPYRKGVGNLNVHTSFRWDSAQLWSVNLERFDLMNLDTPAGDANIHITGAGDHKGINIPRIFYSDGRGSLEGGSVFSWYYEDNSPSSAPRELVLSGSFVMQGAGEQLLASVEYAGQRLDASVSVKGMQISRFSDSIGNAAADAELKLSWSSIDSFQADLAISSLSARIQNNNLRLSAGGHIDNNEIRISDLNIYFADIESAIPQFIIRLDEGYARTDAEIRGFAAGRRVDGSFSLDARFNPLESWLTISEALNAFRGTLHISKLNYADFPGLDPSYFVFARSGDSLLVSGGPRNMLRLYTGSGGNFSASLSAPSPVCGSVIGNISGNTIHAFSSDLYVDLEKLGRLLPPQPDLLLAGGYATAELEIRGSLQDPEFFGLLRGNSVRLQVPNFVTRDIRLVPFTAPIDGNEIHVNQVKATVGTGTATAKGWFRFDRWLPGIFQLDISVPPQTPVPFGFDITGFLASGNASGNLTLAADGGVLSVSGDLYANDSEIGLNTDEVIYAQNAALMANADPPVIVNMTVKTGPSVEFLWPSSRFPILRLNPDMGTVVNVSADSQTGQFSLNSDVKIRSGEILYFERSFYIRSGTLSFNENELRFDPLLTVRAEARDQNSDGPVIISMIVDNAPLLSFTARFESRPSLSQMEILSLLGQNIIGTQPADGSSMQLAFLGSLTDLTAQFAVVKQMERQIRRFTRMDMFSFRTQLLQNAIFTATGLTQIPVDRIAGVGNYFDNTTVFFGKYIGADMFAQTMLSLRYDEYKTTSGGLSFEWDVGIELQSPLFNIRWDFMPTRPENWWVSDNSITLTWSKTF